MATGSTNTSSNSKIDQDIEFVQKSISNHITDTDNPHSVTKANVGLGNCDNTSDINKPISTKTQSALDTKLNKGDLVNLRFYSTSNHFFIKLYDVTGMVTNNGIYYNNWMINGFIHITRRRSYGFPWISRTVILDINVGGNVNNSILKSSNYNVKPVILKYTGEDGTIKYYLSILSTDNTSCGSDITVLLHDKDGGLINEVVSFSSTLPSGYEIYKDFTGLVDLYSVGVGNGSAYYDYNKIKALEDRIAALENK